MNDRRDFFTGAGFDEANGTNQSMNNGMMGNNQGMMNQQSMNNGMMGSNQGMMNQQPMQQMPNNTFGGMSAQPMMNNNQMMNQQSMNNGMMGNNQGMMNQQPMQQMPNNTFGGMQNQPMMDNNQMMNQQPMNNGMMNNNQGMMMNQPNPSFGNGAPLNGKGNSNNGLIKVIGTVVILAIIVILLFVFGHKTLSCTQSNDYGVFSAEMTSEIEYWFGKATSKKVIMKMDVKDLDDDKKEQVMELVEQLADSAEEEDNIKTSIEKNDDSVTLTAKKKITDDDEVDSYDKEKKGLKDEDYVCK